jgi:hypothetical protein
VYFSAHSLLPAKTRAFVDALVAHFQAQNLPTRFSAID